MTTPTKFFAEIFRKSIRDFGRCLQTTFWLGFLINGVWIAASYLANQTFRDDPITPRMIDTLIELLGGLLLTMIVGTSFMKNPRLKELLTQNWRHVLIEFLRTILRVLLGFLALILPGIYLSIRYLFVVPVVLFSKTYQRGRADALKTSWALTKGLMWGLTAIYLVSQTLLGVLTFSAPALLGRWLGWDEGLQAGASVLIQALICYPFEVWIILVLCRICIDRLVQEEGSDELAFQLA